MESQTAEREDEGISKLPEPILHHILSFLSLEESVRTCVLSKSWRYLGSTRPNFSLDDFFFGKNKKKFMYVLGRSLHVYYAQKLFIEDLNLSIFIDEPDDPDEVVPHLKKWIPTAIHELGVKKFHLSFEFGNQVSFDVPSAVFESESLQELYLETCNLRPINYIGNNNHLKTLNLCFVCIEEETFEKIMLSCPLIEHLSLSYCQGFTTININNHRYLKSFDLDGSIEIYLPSTIRRISIDQCPNWYKHRNYFPGLTCLKLSCVPLYHEWFNSFSSNFPCLEELHLFHCNGFDELKLSSRSIKNLDIWMDESTTKATIDAASIKNFKYKANISQSISFTTTSSSEWNSEIRLSLDLDASLWYLKLSELVSEFIQSKINSLVIYHSYSRNQHIEHFSEILVSSGSSYKPVGMKSWNLILLGHYYDSFFSDLMNGLFSIFRPREIEQEWYAKISVFTDDLMMFDFPQYRKNNETVEFLCRTLQLGRSDEEGMSFWQHDLEEVSLEVKNGHCKKWHPVQGTINWSEYVAALLPKKYEFYKLRFRLKWREFANSFD